MLPIEILQVNTFLYLLLIIELKVSIIIRTTLFIMKFTSKTYNFQLE